MAIFYSLNDGILSSASTYGYSMTGAEVTINTTTGVWLGTTDAYGPVFRGDGSAISAIAIHLSARAANPAGSNLYLKLSSGNTIITETYPVSSFTSYDDNSNFTVSYPMTWQLLKLTSPYTLLSSASARISLTTSVANTLAVMCSATQNNYNKLVLKTNTVAPASGDIILVGGSLIGSSIQNVSVTAAPSGTYFNLYIQKSGTLSFPLNFNASLTLVGSIGLQICAEGTLNIGTISSPVLSSITHTISLSNNYMDVHNGGILSIYGSPKLVSTYLTSDVNVGTNSFNTTDSISTWNSSDSVVFIPPTTNRAGFDVLTVNTLGDKTFTTTSNTLYSHNSLISLPLIPTVVNVTRNVIIQGKDSINRGLIRTLDAAKTTICNATLSNFGFNVAGKRGLLLHANQNGYNYLSGNVIDIANTTGIAGLWITTNKNYSHNLTFNDNIIRRGSTSQGLLLESVSAINLTINNNFILSGSGSAGVSLFYISSLSGNSVMNGNKVVGSLYYGSYLVNNSLTGTYGALSYNSLLQGIMVSGVNTGNIVGGGIFSPKEGIYIDASTNNLSSVTFQNMIAQNNTSVGFRVSGTSARILSASIFNPLVLNINGLNSSNNNDAGFEAYNITGNLSSLKLNNNYVYGMKTSIGNGNTVIDGLTSFTDARGAILSTNNILILSGYNYGETSIRNAYLSSYSTSTALCLSLDSTRFSKFSLDNCVLSSTTNNPVKYLATRNLIEGSYLFNNTWFGTSYLGTGISNVYQPNIIKARGFAFTNLNKVDKQHITHYLHGSISLDSTLVKDSGASERLTPTSTTTKLRSSSKYVALNKDEATLVKVYIRKSTNLKDGTEYNGNPPRLMLKRNAALGVEDTVLATATNFIKEFQDFQGISPIVTDNGVLEFYVDCDGTQGWINIDTWSAI